MCHKCCEGRATRWVYKCGMCFQKRAILTILFFFHVSRLCQDHAKRSALCKMKTLRKRQPPESLETLIDDLQHYSEAGNEEKATGTLNLIEKLSLNASTQKLQDYASESDSEDELPTAEQTMRQEDDSDAESIDSDQDDPLRYWNFVTFSGQILNILMLGTLVSLHLKKLSC